jgi:hypothetical protein
VGTLKAGLHGNKRNSLKNQECRAAVQGKKQSPKAATTVVIKT